MPMVNGKKFPYTGKGMMDAKAYKEETTSNPSAKKTAQKKASLGARLKARLDARRTPQQSRYTMPASTPAGLKAQMKDFKDGKTSQLPTPPKSGLRAPLGERGVVPGKIAQSAEKTKYLPKSGKGGSSGAAGSWLQWSGAKKGNN